MGQVRRVSAHRGIQTLGDRRRVVDARPDRVLDLDEAAQHQVGIPNLPVDWGTLQVCVEPLAGGDQAGEVVSAIV